MSAKGRRTDHKKLGDRASSLSGGLETKWLKIVKKGLVAQDKYLAYHGDDSATFKYESLHGYSNYVNAYEYLMGMAIKCYKSGLSEAKKIKYPNNNSDDNDDCKKIKNAITESFIKKALEGDTYNKSNASLLLLGMAMHIVSDTYAHRAYIPGTPYWKHVTHDSGADDSQKKSSAGPQRYKAAGYALGEVLAVWNGNCPPSFEEYDLVGIYSHTNSFRLINYVKYATRGENGISYPSYEKNVKKQSCKFVSEGKGLPE